MPGNLYSSNFLRFATTFPRGSQMSPEVRSYVAYKRSKIRLVKVGKHTKLPFQCNAKFN